MAGVSLSPYQAHMTVQWVALHVHVHASEPPIRCVNNAQSPPTYCLWGPWPCRAARPCGKNGCGGVLLGSLHAEAYWWW